MTTALRSTTRPASRLGWLFALAILTALGCYKPKIKDGGLRCNLDAGVGKSCPEGFKCDLATQTCWRNLDGGVDRASDVVDMRIDEPMPEAPVCVPFDARPNCTPDAGGLCDPYCQSGCDCGKKCSVNSAGALTCNPPVSSGFPKKEMDSCTPLSTTPPNESDNCAPGMVCIEEGCFPRCFQFCRNDQDCPASACTRDIPAHTGQKVCDVPFMDSCVPLPSGQNTGCGNANSAMACYISSTNPTHTVCDCPFNAVGANSPCSRSRDCIKGLVCVDRGLGQPTCLQVCKLSNNGSDCLSNPTAGACHPYTGIPLGQTPHPTFGFCF